MSMLNRKIIKKANGVTLIELLIVLAIIGILAAIGVPQYGVFIAKSGAKRGATDLLRNFRLASTMAIKENREYLITINETANTYRIGFDGDNNGSLIDAADGFGDGGEVRLVELTTTYGDNIAINEQVVTTPTSDPDGNALSYTASFSFQPDGSSSMGTAYIQHIGRGYTFYVGVTTLSGISSLFLWKGDIYNQAETDWTPIK